MLINFPNILLIALVSLVIVRLLYWLKKKIMERIGSLNQH